MVNGVYGKEGAIGGWRGLQAKNVYEDRAFKFTMT